MPIEKEYSLPDLADVAGVTPRTVRYYIAQGLLPAPAGSGRAARYGEAHLARLRLIARLQRQHLPLAEIRVRLDGIDDETVIAELDRPEPRRVAESALDYIHSILGPGSSEPPPPAATAMRAAERAPAAMARPAFLRSSAHGPRRMFDAFETDPSEPPGQRAMSEGSATFTPLTRQPDRSQWDRISLAPDIELHIRRPLGRLQNKRVERLIAIARQLLEEDPS
ncbi:MAG: MerR family transcriptional regulator [Candidatus Limnocylindrales bacterium]